MAAAPPPGIQPLFLTTQTCEILQLRPGTDVSAESAIKRVPRTALLDDIRTRRAISDFQPYRDAIEKYATSAGSTTATGVGTEMTDSMVVVYDAEWRYGQNFYICLTLEAAESVLHPKPSEAELAAAAAAEQAAASKSRPRGWVSLGSEREVEEERCEPAPPSIRVLCPAGNSVIAGSGEMALPRLPLRDSVICRVSIPPTATPAHISSVVSMERNDGVQAIRPTTDGITQTTYNVPADAETQYEPTVLDEQTANTVLASPEFADFLKAAEAACEPVLRENSMVDLLRDDYMALRTDDEVVVEKGVAMELLEVQSFSDIKYTKSKSVSCMRWHPHIQNVLAMSSCRRITLEERIEQSFKIANNPSVISFWSLASPHKAMLFLEAPDDVLVFSFCPNNSNLVVAGCVDGQIVMWDISAHRDRLENASPHTEAQEQPKLRLRDHFDSADSDGQVPSVRHSLLCAIDGGHRGPTFDIMFLPVDSGVGKNGRNREEAGSAAGETNESTPPATQQQEQMLTLSLDGQAFVWDVPGVQEMEALSQSWRPLYKFLAVSPDGTYDYGCTKAILFAKCIVGGLVKKPAGPKPTLLLGTEEGDLLVGSWNLDFLKDKNAHIEHILPAHHYTVTSMQLSPFYEDVFASVGGTSLHLWSTQGLASPILNYEASVHITQFCWSNVRSGVFFLGKADGTVEVWDLMDCFHAPVHVHSVSIYAISQISIRSITPPPGVKASRHGLHYLAVGDDFGTAFIIELPRALIKASRNEVAFVRSLADRQLEAMAYVPPAPLRTLGATATAAPLATVTFDAAAFERDYNALVAASDTAQQ